MSQSNYNKHSHKTISTIVPFDRLPLVTSLQTLFNMKFSLTVALSASLLAVAAPTPPSSELTKKAEAESFFIQTDVGCTLVGESYVHGVMNGEAAGGSVAWQKIELV